MRGTIQGIDHAQGSGLATVILLNESGDVSLVHADAGPIFRAIAASGLREGDELEYETSDLGTMVGFSAVGDGAR
jgi:hypothetical protein